MNYDSRVEAYQKFKDAAYYLVIAIVSFMSVAFLPFINSALTGAIIWPATAMAWAIWAGTKILVSLINVIIFHSFLKQAQVNIKDNPLYLAALEKLKEARKYKNLRPRSPKRYFGTLWGTKGFLLFVSSILSSIVLAQAILVFDLTVFLSYLFTVFMALVFGYLQMRGTEEYWVGEFPAYADDELSRVKKESQEDKEC